LFSAGDFLLVPLGDLCTNGFGGTFDSFGGDLQAGEYLHRFASCGEWHLAAHHGFHAPYAGRGFQTGDTQFQVDRALARRAMDAEVIRASESDRPHHGQQGLRTEFLVVRRMAARTRKRSVVLIRGIVLQQLGQRSRPSLVHGGADGSFDGFQVKAALAAILKDDVQQSVYFAGNFLADGLRRFFPWAVDSVCPMGRNRQIFRLTSTNSPVKVWNLRNSAISLSALRTAAREGRFCVTVLPSIFWVSWAWGPCPASSGLAQWHEGFPQRREAFAMEPGWKSPSPEICRSSADLSSIKGGSGSGMEPPCLTVSYTSRIRAQKKKTPDA